MKNILKLITIILMALFSFKAYGKELVYYELILDFGNDFAFIQETLKSKNYCELRVKALALEKINARCIERRGKIK